MDTQRLQQAIALREADHVEEALKEISALTDLTTDPEEKASLLLNESRCYRLLGQFSKAWEQLSRAQGIATTTECSLYLYEEDAILHWHRGDRDRALAILNRLHKEHLQLLLRPEHHELYARVQSSRGMLLTELTRYREAKQLLEECLTFDPDLIDKVGVLRDLGVCFDQLKQAERAKGYFQEALQNGAQGSYAFDAHYYLGTIYYAERAYGKALMELKWCLDHIDQGQLPKKHICEWLARTARTLGMKEDAERYDKVAKG